MRTNNIHTIFSAFLSAALLALTVSGCVREMAPEWEKPAELTARIEGAEPGTKTSYDSEGPVGEFQWSEGDQIAIPIGWTTYDI